MTETFDLSRDQARAYEDQFVPALFAQWVPDLLACARLRAGHATGKRVLDVACGTGVVARAAAGVVGPTGDVVGLDRSEAMLGVAEEVARDIAPPIEWRVGDAAALPFGAASFDAVLCQSALFFFPDPAAAVREMARVLRPGGSVALQTYAGLAEQPGYGLFVDAVVRQAGASARSLLDTYWSMGDLGELSALLQAAGLRVYEARSVLGTVAFPTISTLVAVEVRGTPLGDRIDAEVYAAIEADAKQALAPFVDPSGPVSLPIRARLVAAEAPEAAQANGGTAQGTG